ncbi:MAG TPA: NADH-quinone oxidoreductase subunit C [Burkholderiales bacterium]|nr:NADH-quinone oxidoreductase subunit C [Burkholderiales bacterium]
MNDLASPSLELSTLPGTAPAWHATVDAAGWRAGFEAAASAGGRLGALWASDERDRTGGMVVHGLLVTFEGLVCLHLPVVGDAYPDVSDVFPSAALMQRAVRDLLGLHAGSDARGWLRHAAWRENVFPLRRDVPREAILEPGDPRYDFVRVEGEGVHEIPVGPVHAGTIEPGHFRFSVVGERVLRLEERLGYKHKGIEKRFEGMALGEAARLAGRVSGDSTVAYAWAFAQAAEAIAGVRATPRATWLRALLLERERIANHLGDLGQLGNDAGLAFGLAQFSRLKEDLLRANADLFGHRYLMDCVVPGGLSVDLHAHAAEELLAEADRLEREVNTLRAIFDDHAGLQERAINCGRLTPQTAARLGVVGLAARASGLAVDARVYPGLEPYDALSPRMSTHRNGDVAARMSVRFDELLESLELQRRIVGSLPAPPAQAPLPAPGAGFAIGWVEGWRGEVFVGLELDAAGRVRRCHPHDPSWHNWPAVEYAVLGNIVPDFPLINKSFNLAYAGVDL